MRVRIPSPLFSYTGGQALVEASGENVHEVTCALDRLFPGIRFRIIDEQEKIRPHVKIFVNQRQIMDLTTGLNASDEVAIVQAFSGG